MLPNYKKFVVAAAVLMMVVAVSACGNPGPAGTVEDFLQAALDKDCAEMVELSSAASLGSQTREEAARECEQSEELSSMLALFEGIGLEEFDAVSEDISGDEATVEARMTMKIGDNEETIQETFRLVLEEDKWRVDL